jgi:DNA adenine methylase
MRALGSPLRYPGGKAILSPFLAEVLAANQLRDGIYAEPYAGGAGAALSLLFAEHVHTIILNDADPCIYAFWKTILERKNSFISLVMSSPICLDEWKKQREIYQNYKKHSRIRVAFATFYLNRCNRSGIIVNGGPIGGYGQEGKWRIDARFNKSELISRIEKIWLYRDRIKVCNLDAIDFLEQVIKRDYNDGNTLVYLDPPYYVKGRELYLNHYQHEDHAALARYIKIQREFKWIMSYDDVSEIRLLYEDRNMVNFNLDYCASKRKVGKEILVCSPDLHLPEDHNLLKNAI